MSSYDFGLVVPCFNYGSRLLRTLERIEAWKAASGHKVFLCIVDDGSTDDTATVAGHFLRGRESWCRLRRLPKNSGKGLAIREGFREIPAEVSFLFFVDCDLHYGLGVITERLLPALQAGADVAILDRSWDKFQAASTVRKVLSYGFNHLKTVLTGLTFEDSQAGLKGFRAEFVRPLLPLARVDGFAFDVELLSIACDFRFNVSRTPVRFAPGKATEASSVTLGKALRMFWDLLRIAKARSMNQYACQAFEERISRQVYEIRSGSEG